MEELLPARTLADLSAIDPNLERIVRGDVKCSVIDRVCHRPIDLEYAAEIPCAGRSFLERLSLVSPDPLHPVRRLPPHRRPRLANECSHEQAQAQNGKD